MLADGPKNYSYATAVYANGPAPRAPVKPLEIRVAIRKIKQYNGGPQVPINFRPKTMHTTADTTTTLHLKCSCGRCGCDQSKPTLRRHHNHQARYFFRDVTADWQQLLSVV